MDQCAALLTIQLIFLILSISGLWGRDGATGWLVREEIDLCQYVIVLGQTPRWSKSVVLNWLLLQDPDSTSGIKRDPTH